MPIWLLIRGRMDLDGAYKFGLSLEDKKFKILEGWAHLKLFLFKGYYAKLQAHAEHLYRVSDRYRERAAKYGLGFAERMSPDDYVYFIGEVRREPLIVHLRILLNIYQYQ